MTTVTKTSTTTNLPPPPGLVSALAGNATRDPELRYAANGRAWASFGLAVNKRVRNDAGEWEDGPAQFFHVVAFGDLAENVAASVTKGTRLVVIGRLEPDVWTGKDGTERYGWKLLADDIGASMRRATVAVAKAERRAPQAPDPFTTDEEPF